MLFCLLFQSVLKRAGEIKDKHNLDVNLEEDIEEDEEGTVAEPVEDIPEDDKPASANPEVCAANEDEKPFIVFFWHVVCGI
jgi:hypothetical protein